MAHHDTQPHQRLQMQASGFCAGVYTIAPLDCPVYMEIPAGFTVQDNNLVFAGPNHQNTDKRYVVKLLKNMYGLKQAGYNWYNKLTDELLKKGFTQSAVDKCLSIRKDCIVIIYVDDCLLFSPHDNILVGFLHQNFKITSSTSITTYLGMEVTHNTDGTIYLCQPGLIDKVIKLCGLEAKSNEHLTPADKIIHAFDDNIEPRQHSWSYRQVIGILNYIAARSRPDITFAVHQCARFSNNPNRQHELAVRRIVRYLKGTRDTFFAPLRHRPSTAMRTLTLLVCGHQNAQINQLVLNLEPDMSSPLPAVQFYGHRNYKVKLPSLPLRLN
jgi:hypothetical protein